MRTARLVGPTADGTSMVLVTEDGEELTVAVDPEALLRLSKDDPALRSALREASARLEPDPTRTPSPAAPPPAGPARRPPRRRETPPMDTPLSPRDIQTRIRSGESLEDVVADSGMDAERVERFAAPVLAEREHMALTALGSSVRRRGESSGHRPLRAVVAERLLGQGVDADDVGWDAWKREDGHWQVVADFELLGEPRHAEFHYDPQGRFSVAEDDDARWLAGERPSPLAAVVDRDDELALVRATREPSQGREDEPEAGRHDADQADGRETASAPEEVDAAVLEVAEELTAVLQVVPPVELSEEELDELLADDPESDERVPDDARLRTLPRADADDEDDEDDATREPTLVEPRDEAAEPTIAVVRHLTSVTVEVDASDEDTSGVTSLEDARSALDTLYDMLGGDGYAEDSTRVYAGLSDAAAVPVVDEHEFEPPADVLVPAEPGPEAPEAEAPTATPSEAASPASNDAPTVSGVPVAVREVPRDAEAEGPTDPAAAAADGTEEGSASQGDDEVRHAAAEAPPALDVDEPLIPSPGASRKPGRRKRASVPSWDEIMFGGPKPG